MHTFTLDFRLKDQGLSKFRNILVKMTGEASGGRDGHNRALNALSMVAKISSLRGKKRSFTVMQNNCGQTKNK